MLVSGPDDGTAQEPDQEPAERPAESGWARRRRLDAVFGDVLPETTRDDREERDGSRDPRADPTETWLKAQVPPHHGG